MSKSLFHRLNEIADKHPETISTIEMAINIISLLEKQESDDSYLIVEYKKHVFDLLWFIEYLMNREGINLPESDTKHAEHLMNQSIKLSQHNE